MIGVVQLNFCFFVSLKTHLRDMSPKFTKVLRSEAS